MKTKLLKRVRKNYSIIKYTEIYNPNNVFYGYKPTQKRPIYVVHTANSLSICFIKRRLAYEHLIKEVKKDFYRLKKYKNKSEKIF